MLPSLADIEAVIAPLGDVLQNPVYHAEGNALIHTHNVMNELQRLAGYQALPEEEKQLLLVAAALHDWGKLETTVWKDEKWTSPGHAIVGTAKVRALLMTRFGLYGTPEAMRRRECICALIRYHMKPLEEVGGSRRERTMHRLSAIGRLIPGFTLEKLCLIVEADNRGRICADNEARLRDLDAFRVLARAEGCYTQPYEADAPEGEVPTVILCGVPWADLPAYAEKEYPHLPMVDAGDAGQLQACLREHRPFVTIAPDGSAEARRQITSLAHQYNRACVRIEYIEAGGCLPNDAAERLLKLEPPMPGESEDVRWVCIPSTEQ